MTQPYKILDAPKLVDDFYLNLLDWGQKNNKIGVALGELLYVWDPVSNSAEKVHKCRDRELTSVCFSKRDSQLMAVGSSEGTVSLVDIERKKTLRQLPG
jgi:cell division cycle 20-like protein 1 (cofactor of APC complex)